MQFKYRSIFNLEKKILKRKLHEWMWRGSLILAFLDRLGSLAGSALMLFRQRMLKIPIERLTTAVTHPPPRTRWSGSSLSAGTTSRMYAASSPTASGRPSGWFSYLGTSAR